MMIYWSGGTAPRILNVGTRCRCRFIPGERAPGTQWIWYWLGHRAGLDAVVMRKNLITASPGIEPRSSGPYSGLCTDYAMW